jgi:hypothetical protein
MVGGKTSNRNVLHAEIALLPAAVADKDPWHCGKFERAEDSAYIGDARRAVTNVNDLSDGLAGETA